MDLETIFRISIVGTGFLVCGGMGYSASRVIGATNRVVEDATRILDRMTNYLAPRIRTDEELESSRELARTRAKYI